jgi:PAS domain S-box-containing protein
LFEFRIDVPEDIERIAAFLATSLVVSVLTTKVRASEARFRSVVDHATDGFFLFDEHQAIVDVNKQACESLGYSREEMIGMRPRDFDAALDQSLIARIGERVNTGETGRAGFGRAVPSRRGTVTATSAMLPDRIVSRKHPGEIRGRFEQVFHFSQVQWRVATV